MGLLILSSILWGSSFVSIKIGLEYLDPYNFAFLRLASAASILLAIQVARRRFRFGVLKQGSAWLLGLLNCVGFLLQYLGLLFTTAAKTALLVDLNVVIIAILSWRFFQESFGRQKQLGVLLGVLGAVMITTNGDLSSVLTTGQLFGDVLVFSSGMVWALFVVLHKRVFMKKDQDVIELSTVVMIATTLLLFPIAVILGSLPSSNIPIQGWVIVAYSAVACTVLPYAMWVAALKAVTATVAAVVGMLEIVAAMILSSIFLGEAYNTVTLVGALLVLIALFAVAS